MSGLKPMVSDARTALENPERAAGPLVDSAAKPGKEPPSAGSLSVSAGVSGDPNPGASDDRLYIQTSGEDFDAGVSLLPQAVGAIPPEPGKDSPFGGSFSVSGGLFWGSITADVIDLESVTAVTMAFEKTFVPYVVIDGSLSWHWAFLKAGILFGIPLTSAEAAFANYPDAPDSTMWQKGEFNAFLQSHFQGYAGIGYRVPLGRWFLSHSAGVSYRKRQWNTLDGSWRYNEEVNGKVLTVYKDVSGEFMALTETTLYPSISFEAGVIISLFEIRGEVSLFPFIFSKAGYRFNLISPSNAINTSLESTGLGGGGNVTMIVHPPKIPVLSFRLGFGYEYMSLTKGEVTNRIEGIGSTDAAKDPRFSAHLKSSLFNINIGIGISLK